VTGTCVVWLMLTEIVERVDDGEMGLVSGAAAGSDAGESRAGKTR